MVQINGKMLIASSSSIVGATNSQAIARSERPRMRSATPAGVAWAARATRAAGLLMPCFAWAWPSLRLAVVLEDLLPVDHQCIERLLGGALVGHDVIMHALLHRQQQLRIRGL